MPLPAILTDLLARASFALGFETLDRFPRQHQYARTHWDGAYFDIASDQKPEAVERALCAAIANTPTIIRHITHPTPAMQRTLLGVIETRLRRSCGVPDDLLLMLIDAYASPHTLEARHGLRAAIEAGAHLAPGEQVRALLAFLGTMPAAFDVIEARS